jgi:hydroxymethylpyrimidine/phosphomethylpyrimidine kinase
VIGKVLVIAGSDSGGGAGIQGDIKTITALGAYAATAVTAITVQNTLGVTGVHPIPVEMVIAQAQAVHEDIGVDVVKTGMLGEAEVVRAVAAWLRETQLPAVIDPVMIAKGGHALLADTALSALRAELIPQAMLLTPNAPEAAALTGRRIETEADMRTAAQDLMAMGAKAVLMKGGHLEGMRLVDLLITRDDEVRFEGERIATRHTHGTGCTLASAIAAGLANGAALTEAVAEARAYVVEAILRAPGFGAGHGPLDHAFVLRRAAEMIRNRD